MAEIPDVIPGTPVESDWGNTVRDRVTSRYADAASRALSEPLPQAGQISWLDDPGVLESFDGVAWVPIQTGPPQTLELPLTLLGQGKASNPAIPGFDTWFIAAAGDLILPAHWNTARVLVYAEGQRAGGDTGIQLECRASIDGVNGSENQSGSAVDNGVAISSNAWTQTIPGGQTVPIACNLLVRNPGGSPTQVGVIKYALFHFTAARDS